MTINGTTCSRGSNLRLPFALNVTLIKSVYFSLYRSQLCYLREGASKVASKGLFTRREGYTFARVTLARGFKLALVYNQISQVGLPYHPGQLCKLCWRVSWCVSFFVTVQNLKQSWSSLWKTRWIQEEKEKYCDRRQNITFCFSDVYN